MTRDLRAAQYAYGQELKQLIDESPYNYTQIAEKVGVSTKTLSNWFNGNGSPSELQALIIKGHCWAGEQKKLVKNKLASYGVYLGRGNG